MNSSRDASPGAFKAPGQDTFGESRQTAGSLVGGRTRNYAQNK